MLPIPARNYLLAALDNTPTTVSALLSSLLASTAAWDTRPYADRFSLREIVAHLADWEDVFLERFERTVGEDNPVLDRPDLDQRATAQGYSTADPAECLARFQAKRVSVTSYLRTLPESAWLRTAHLERIGDMPLEGLAALMLGHDSYHLRQLAEWHSLIVSRS